MSDVIGSGTSLPVTLQRLGRIFGLLVMAVGGLVLAGWALGLPLITSFGPGLPPMVPNTALSLALAGEALWLSLARRPPRLARLNTLAANILASVVTLFGGLTLGEHFFGWRLPLDTLLLPFLADQGPIPGRLPFNTAFSLVCIGLALLLLRISSQGAAVLAQLLALLAALNGLRVLLGFIDRESGSYTIPSPEGVALHTATALVLLGCGVLCARPRAGLMAIVTGPGYGGHVFRLLLPAAVLLPLLIGALTLRGHLSGFFSLGFGMILLTFANLLVFWWLARALNQSESVALYEAQRAHALFTDLERSNEALMQAYDETLAGWSYALELRDGETRGHTQRVTELTLRLAEASGMSENELVHIRRGALLHDIGKLGVPDAILRKAGRLSDEEWAVMRKHPVYAYEWLAPITYLRPALVIPYCHHERWDGTGYPRGLKGEAIPLAARLFAVVDVWDALCSERPYHLPWPVEEVKAYLAAQAGTHFDPAVVALFLRLIQDDDVLRAREVS